MRKYEVTINQKDYSVLVKSFSADDAELEINGKTYNIKMDGPIRSISSFGQPVNTAAAPVYQAAPVMSPPPVQTNVPAPSAPASSPAPTSGAGQAVTAPIPGSVLAILVKVGDKVDVGQTVITMEAMKMENEINAHVAGTVDSILVKVGDAVNQGQRLVEIG